jgi:protein-S-isoprenylcysteine O-methyltransferase Ste14
MSPDLKAVIFVIITNILVIVSKRSLKNPRSHGFWRFFAWEAIVGLGLLHIDHWFRDSFAWYQLISWLLLILSGLLAVHTLVLLRFEGRQGPRPDQPALISIEKTTELITRGAFRYIRHPAYCSLLLLAWGVFFKSPNKPGLIFVAIATACLFATGKLEETENLLYFGEPYRDYMKRTRRFVPFLF